MSQDELVIGFEHQLEEHWWLGARFVGRALNNIVEDFTIDRGLWLEYGVACHDPSSESFGSCRHEYRLGNPGSDFHGHYDLNGDGLPDEITIPAEVLGYPDAERTYLALELSLRRRLADRWMLM